MTGSVQTALLGRYAREVDSGVAQLRQQRWLKRLWEKDAGLWSADPAVQASIRQRLGWLTIPKVMANRLDEIRRFADEIRREGLTHALLLGMGGSSLFPEVCRLTFGVAQGGVDVGVLDSTDPAAIRAFQNRAALTKTLAIVSSKSGTTAEVSALSKYFYEAFRAAGGKPGDHCIAITDAGTPLEQLATAWHFRRIFTLGPESGQDVGGRFSALSYFGLVPAALLGIDLAQLVERGNVMLSRCGPDAPIGENPAAQLAAALSVLAGHGRNKLTLLFAQGVRSFGTWVEQLVAESTGKQGKGIIPIDGEPLRDPASYADDRVFVELQSADQVDRDIERQARVLAEAGHPVISIRWRDRYDLGGEVMKWSLATTIAGSLLGVNPFDEPNVKESKDRTNALLDYYSREKKFPDGSRLLCQEGNVAIFGERRDEGAGQSLDPLLRGLFSQLRQREYVALLSFLPRTEALDRALQTLRSHIAERLRCATTIGFGPRYLHSTGQLYKGGPDAAIFLLLTAESATDLPIPGEPLTFNILKGAQALGDFEAMQQRGRRILHVRLRGTLEHTMAYFLRAVDNALASSSAPLSQNAKLKS